MEKHDKCKPDGGQHEQNDKIRLAALRQPRAEITRVHEQIDHQERSEPNGREDGPLPLIRLESALQFRLCT